MKIFIKSPLLLIFVCFVLTINAQVKVCDLQLNVQDRESKANIETVIANLVNVTNNNVITAESVDGNHYFRNLNEGVYILSAGAENHMTSLKLIKFACADDSQFRQTNFNSIYLLKGKPSEQIHIIDKDFMFTQKLDLPRNIFALSLPKPIYPKTGNLKTFGKVKVEVFVNEKGNVYQAKAVSGDSFFWKASEDAAKRAQFIPAVIDGKPAGFVTNVNYNFVAQ